ncbi:MAG TPA: tetratricopeptide repeat protein [Vicinamibacteria bacterium]|nr:tetratricopeptide repeat protein [Vicinamibacteria bacterium]
MTVGMRFGRLLRDAVVLALAGQVLALPAEAAETWLRARTDHFDLFTNVSEAEARRAATALDRFREVLGRLLPPPRRRGGAPVAVLAFRDQDSFRPFTPRHDGEPRAADGFFQGGTGRSYIAVNLGNGRADPYDPLFHEWAHLALNQALPAQPAWVAEGLAEVYSAWRQIDGDVVIGLSRPEHMRTLAGRGLMPLELLLRADYTSDAYHKPRLRDVFYAQAWAFAHHLLLGRTDGHARLHDYLDGIARGLDPVESYQRAFGEDLAAGQARLQAYVAMGLAGARTSAPELTAAIPLTVDAPARAEIEYLFGDLLLHGSRTREARGHLARALEADPGYLPAREALAQVALRQARWDEARAHLRAALEDDPDSPFALYQFAEAMVREAMHRSEVLSDDDTAEAVRALERCVARAPYHADAVHLLARLKPAPVHQRIPLLEAAFLREPHRTELGITLAGLYTKDNDMGRSTATLLRAREAARDDAMRFLCSHLLGRVSYVASVTAEARGTLRSLECLSGGGLTFLVEAAGSTLRLHAPSPVAAMLYGPDGETLQRDLVCGSHAENVTAWYRRAGEADPAGADGTLLSLSFPQPSPGAPSPGAP